MEISLNIMKDVVLTTIVIPRTDTHVLLGMKKRGFGEGRWNGFGGKIKDGENIEDSARRELLEEAKCDAETLTQIGILNFTFEDKNESPIKSYIFQADNLVGEPSETEEMYPQWFLIKDVPYEKMWPDDIYWWPHFLDKKEFNGHCHFKDFDTILHFDFDE